MTSNTGVYASIHITSSENIYHNSLQYGNTLMSVCLLQCGAQVLPVHIHSVENEPKYIQNGPEMKEISSKCLKYFCLLGGCYTCIGLHPYWYHNCLCMCMHWKGWKLSTKHCSLSLYTTALLQPQCSECQFGPVRSFATKSYKYYELWQEGKIESSHKEFKEWIQWA